MVISVVWAEFKLLVGMVSEALRKSWSLSSCHNNYYSGNTLHIPHDISHRYNLIMAAVGGHQHSAYSHHEDYNYQ